MAGGGYAGREQAELERLKRSFPERIRTARRQRGLSKTELAKRVGVTSTTLGAWLRGVRLPRISQLCLLARALQVPVEYLLDPMAAVPDSFQPQGHEEDLIQYLSIEQGRGCAPTVIETSEAFETDVWPTILHLLTLRLLEPTGLRLTKAGLQAARKLEA